MIVHFDDINGIVDDHGLKFLFTILNTCHNIGKIKHSRANIWLAMNWTRIVMVGEPAFQWKDQQYRYQFSWNKYKIAKIKLKQKCLNFYTEY